MKKFRFLLLLFFLFSVMSSVDAAVQMKVSAIEEFKTDSPSNILNVKVREDISLDKYELKAGDILSCKVIEVTDPKRGKRNADIYVQPVSFISNGETVNINEEFLGKYSKTVLSKEELKKMPKAGIVKKAAVTVGGFYVKGLKQGVSLVKGIANNEGGHPVRSGVKQVYKDSPLSYVEKGSELDILPNDEFYLIFKKEDIEESEKPNYNYTQPAN